ncbi:MAG: polysaccharide pyruvyl transferase family protein [Clostridia bacterium]|nr:polysaccharide pyruvyl transferase family protein [Clostridia bacterium]
MNIKKFLIKAYEEIYGIPLIVKCFWTKVMFPQETIVLKGFFIWKKWKIANFNWGDDINLYFFKEVTGKRVVLLPDTKLAKCFSLENYLCIGSTIMSFDMRNTVVWGTGLLNDKMDFRLKSKPKKILAVRGPLTRRWLMEQGVECPEVYGDPALLLPLFYHPTTSSCYRIGVIPHYKDLNNPVVKKISNQDGVKLIRISEYNDWHDFINQINSCDSIVSSSLHGIIVSEAYKKPVVWAKFRGSEYVPGWDFKFHDYFESVKKENVLPIDIDEATTIEELEERAMKWSPGNIDIEKLKNSCPFW